MSCSSESDDAQISAFANKGVLAVNDCLEFVRRDNIRGHDDESSDESSEALQKKTTTSFDSFNESSSQIHSCTENDEEIVGLSCSFQLPIEEPTLLAFTESLLISVEGGVIAAASSIPSLIDVNNDLNVVGGVCINVTAEMDLLTTFIAAQYSSHDGGVPRCVEIMSVCDRNLKLKNERKVDTTCGANCKEEKSLMIYLDEATERYVGVKKYISQNIRKRHRAEICINKTGDLILAGENFLLLRYIATINFCGRFQAWTIDMDGHICLSHYHVEAPQPMLLNKNRYNIIKITRIIQASSSSNAENTHEIYHYLPTGHLIKYKSSRSAFTWHINPLSQVPPFKRSNDEASHLQWKNDAELLATFLDKKNDLQKKYQNELLYKRPAIKSIIRDYVLCLLRNKPENILDFTLEHFIALKETKEDFGGKPRRVNNSCESSIDDDSNHSESTF